MAGMSFSCPHCGEAIESPGDGGESVVTCPRCYGEIQAGVAPPPVPPASPARAASASQPAGGFIVCVKCGQRNGRGNHRCARCGQFLHGASAPGAPDLGDSAGMRMLMPVGRSGWAIASGYLALFSVLIVFAPFALATGILAVRDIRRNPEKHGMGRAIFGIVMGTLGTLFLVLFIWGLISDMRAG